jgi:hypothetical protein
VVRKLTELTQQQWLVLQVIYDGFRQTGTWPTFGVIDRPIRKQLGIDLAQIIASMPDSLILPLHAMPSPTDEVRLSLSAIAACVGSEQDAQRFPALLRWFAQRESEFESSNPNALPEVTAAEVREHFGLDPEDRATLSRLFNMLRLDNWGTSGSNWTSADQWTVSLGREVWRFRDVQTVEDCLLVRNEWVEEARAKAGYQAFAAPLPEPAPAIPEAAGNAYVDEKITGALRAKAENGKFDLSKLLALTEELNESYANKQTYSCLALVRAILDHVPPIFGCGSFDDMVRSYSSPTWTRTDKDHAKSLRDCRGLGHDALHRMISKNVDPLSMEDVPAPARLRVLLREVVELL